MGALQDDTPSMCFKVDAAGTVLAVNRFGADHLGYEPEDLVGTSVLSVFLGPDQGAAAEHLAACVAQPGRVFKWELRKLHRDGRVIWVRETARAVRGGQDDVMALIVCEDITDLKQAEAARREAERKYREIFDNAVEGIFQVTPGGCFLTANPAMARMLGYGSPEELMRDPDPRHGYSAECLAFHRLVDEQGAVQAYPTQAYRKDGTPIWVSVNARAVRDARGVVVYYEGTAEDVTERVRADEMEAELRILTENAAAEWELTFDSMESPILIVDAQGRIARLNRAARELARRRSYDEILGQAVADVATGQPWQQASAIAAMVAKTGAATQAQVRDSVTGKTWDLTAEPSPGPAGEERVILVARDITRMVELQETLRHSATVSAMGMLVAGVAHEVRNPLFSISANLDLFTLKGGHSAPCADLIGILRPEVERLAALMRDLLDYGRPMRSEREPGAMRPVVQDAVERCARLARTSGVAVRNQVEGGFPPVLMDRNRLVQVFQNLIQNAIQHSPAGGTVTVRAERQDDERGHFVVVRVADSGCGLHPDDQSRLFTPFCTRRRGGTGLGLAIVRRIMEEHQGEVSAANRPEGGAVFTLKLPCGATGRESSAFPSCATA